MGRVKSLLGSLFIKAVSKQVNKSKIPHVTAIDASIGVKMGWNEGITAAAEKIAEMSRANASVAEIYREITDMGKVVPKSAYTLADDRRRRSEAVINARNNGPVQ